MNKTQLYLDNNLYSNNIYNICIKEMLLNYLFFLKKIN